MTGDTGRLPDYCDIRGELRSIVGRHPVEGQSCPVPWCNGSLSAARGRLECDACGTRYGRAE